MVRHGDDLVKWVVHATFPAEEPGVTTVNADDMVVSGAPNIRRLLDPTGKFGHWHPE